MVLLIALAEWVCVLAGWGEPSQVDDPFVGFAAVHLLFEVSADGQSLAVPQSRRKFFAAESFPVNKPANGFRIFCLGGSTVQGRPFSIPTAFTTWLELALNEIDPAREWDAINCGGISYASYRLVPILQECLTHQPNLIVLCTGHNEFLEDRSYGDVRQSAWMSSPAVQQLSRSRLVTLTRRLKDGATGTSASGSADHPVLTADADPILDYHDGLAAYHRDDIWRAGVILHFEQNVRRMIHMAREAHVPIVLMKPSSNLSSQPPFKSEHRANLSADELQQWDALVTQARDLYRTNLPTAVQRLRQALQIDAQYALTYYELGRCLEAQHDYASARQAFVTARDLDVCPLRILSEMEQVLEQIAEEMDVLLLDMHALLEREAAHGILGDYWLIDHIHPSIRGHQLVASRLVDVMATMQLVTLPADWQKAVDGVWQRHWESLDPLYFIKGQQTRNSVRGWTQGRADGASVESRFPHLLRTPTPASSRSEHHQHDEDQRHEEQDRDEHPPRPPEDAGRILVPAGVVDQADSGRQGQQVPGDVRHGDQGMEHRDDVDL